MKKIITLTLVFVSTALLSQNAWKQKFNSCKDFIENVGQYNENKKIKHTNFNYCTNNNGIEIFISKNGITYLKREIVYVNEKEKIGKLFVFFNKEKEEEELKKKIKQKFLTVNWLNTNSNCQIITENKTTNYYTYASNTNANLKANAYKKIIYKNIYNHIDLEYVIPKDSNGIKYSFIIHPQGNIHDIKWAYDEKLLTIENNNLVVNSKIGKLVEHKPYTYIKETNEYLTSSMMLNNNELKFSVNYNLLNNGINKSNNTIVIDPWVQTPSAIDNSKAFDVNYDNASNVYVCGGLQQLQKYSSTGGLLWTYTLPSTDYTDFAIDPVTSTTYMFDLYPANIYKIDANGNQVTAGMNPLIDLETWRAEYDPCQNQLVIASGNASGGTQAFAVSASNLTNVTPKDILNESDLCHDLNMLTIDDNGAFVYFHTTESVCGNPILHNNELVKCPLPNLLPTVYLQPTGYGFKEVMLGQNYFTPPSLGGNSHGFNGLKVKGCYLYGYDGATVKVFDKNNGTTISSFSSGGSIYQSAGLDVDNCGNIYVGVGSSIKVYSSNNTLVTTIPANNTVYDLRLTNNNKLVVCGDGFVQQIDLTANLQTVNVIDIVNATSCAACNGSAKAEFLCNNVATSACISYLWSNGATTQTVGGLCPGIYTVSVNANVCYPSPNTATVEILGGANSPTLQINQPTLTCAQNSIDITAPGITAGSSGGTTLSYWMNSATTNTLTNPTNITASGTYYIKYEDASGCAVTKPLTITFNSVVPIPNFTVTDACINNNVTINNLSSIASGSISSYIWNFGADSNPVTTSTLQAPSIISYSVFGVKTITLTITSDGGCAATTTKTLLVSDNPQSSFTVSNVCLGLASSFINTSTTNSGSITTTQWDFTNDGVTDNNTINPNYIYPTTGTYTVSLTSITNKGCTNVFTATTSVNSAATVSLITTAACYGSPNLFSSVLTPTVSGINTYTYNFGDGNTSSASAPSYTYQNASQTIATVYNVSVTVNSNGCVSYGTNTVMVYPLPIPNFIATNTCVNTPSNYFDGAASITNDGTSINSYNWFFGDTKTESKTIAQTTHTYNNASVYTVTLSVTSGLGCMASITKTVEVYPKPVANYEIAPDLGTILAPKVGFVNTSSQHINFWWDFGDGQNAGKDSTTVSPIHTYDTETPTSYISMLIVENNFGCRDTTYKTVNIGPEFIFYIPNSFSPNNDGINDVFTGTGVGIIEYEMNVFDRWGSVVYTSNDIYKGWDGKDKKGEPSKLDVYSWKVDLKDVFNKKHNYVGHVTLLR